jgi:hypothetical protein
MPLHQAHPRHGSSSAVSFFFLVWDGMPSPARMLGIFLASCSSDGATRRGLRRCRVCVVALTGEEEGESCRTGSNLLDGMVRKVQGVFAVHLPVPFEGHHWLREWMRLCRRRRSTWGWRVPVHISEQMGTRIGRIRKGCKRHLSELWVAAEQPQILGLSTPIPTLVA